jgi:hypothetical protein
LPIPALVTRWVDGSYPGVATVNYSMRNANDLNASSLRCGDAISTSAVLVSVAAGAL